MRRYVSAAVAVANRQRYRGGTPYIYAAGVWNGGESRADLTQGVNALTDIQLMSASLIGHSGSSTFRLLLARRSQTPISNASRWTWPDLRPPTGRPSRARRRSARVRCPGFFEGTGMPEPGWWEALWPDPAKVLRDVGVTPGMDVVDLCSGDGWFTFPLAKIARSVIGIDIDAALLEAAKLRIAERGGAPN